MYFLQEKEVRRSCSKKHRAWLDTEAWTVYKYQRAVVYWENELGIKWDDESIERDHIGLAKENITENCPLAEFLIETKAENAVNEHSRLFIKWLRQEENIVCMNQLKERIFNDENDFFLICSVMTGYIDAENVHDFKVKVNNYDPSSHESESFVQPLVMQRDTSLTTGPT